VFKEGEKEGKGIGCLREKLSSEKRKADRGERGQEGRDAVFREKIS